MRTVQTDDRLVIKSGDEADILLVGELDVATSNRLDGRLRTVPAESTLLLDLAGITFIDSSALRVLIAHHQRLSDAGGRFAIVNASAPARRLLEIAGLDGRLIIDD